MPKPTYSPALHELHRLGIEAPWQAALYLPNRYEDFTSPISDFTQALHDVDAYYVLTVTGSASIRRDGKAPRLSALVRDDNGRSARVMVFGFFEEFRPHLVPGQRLGVLARAKQYGDMLVLAVREVVDPAWHGRVRAVYPTPPRAGSLAGSLRESILALVDVVHEEAAQQLLHQVGLAGRTQEAWVTRGIGCPNWTLSQVLKEAHRPTSVAYGLHAAKALERMAALVAMHRATQLAVARQEVAAMAWTLNTLTARRAALPFALTACQQKAVSEIATDLGRTVPMKRCLTGDTGSGKTAVFALVLVALADAGGTGLVLLPNEPLARQVYREIRQWWPDAPVSVVTSDSAERVPTSARIFVGTTALHHRVLPSMDLVITDEQHKFSVAQRDHHVGASTHQLEVSATCIPRSLALAKYGYLSVSRLTTPPCAKSVQTTVVAAAQRGELFARVKRTIHGGGQVLVVYPKRESTSDVSADRYCVEQAAGLWERTFPNQVRALTGTDENEAKEAVLTDMREARANILVATTVVEVGINLPRLRQIIVVHPERFGLATLHQLRGRVAREGGEGWCDLYCPDELKPEQAQRLQVLVDNADGFQVAEADLQLRGFGDLGEGRQQAGAFDGSLIGRPLTPVVVDEAMPVWEFLRTQSTKTITG